MIWRRLKKSAPEEDEQFRKDLDEVHVSWHERLLMVLVAYGVIVLPCLLVLILLSLGMMWLFGVL